MRERTSLAAGFVQINTRRKKEKKKNREYRLSSRTLQISRVGIRNVHRHSFRCIEVSEPLPSIKEISVDKDNVQVRPIAVLSAVYAVSVV